MKDTLNMKVKYSEPFRPFARVIAEAEAAHYFELGKKQASPYMTFVFDVKPAFRDKIPGALHVDGTSLLQTVTPEQNPQLHRLLAKFGEKAAVFCLVSTSFNVAGEPIVCSPTDAVNTFLNSRIDLLVVGIFDL